MLPVCAIADAHPCPISPIALTAFNCFQRWELTESQDYADHSSIDWSVYLSVLLGVLHNLPKVQLGFCQAYNNSERLLTSQGNS